MKSPEYYKAHTDLLKLHRAVGGQILRGTATRTPILEHRTADAYVAWGADYWPVGTNFRSLVRAILRPANDCPELGVPAMFPCEGWVTAATRCDNGSARLAQYNYTAGSYRFTPRIATVNEGDLTTIPFDALDVHDMRGGIGYDRAVSRQLGKSTRVDVEGLEQMAATMRQLHGQIQDGQL